jgi:hypothetical protein
MANPFVKTETVVKKTLVDLIDTRDAGDWLMSVKKSVGNQVVNIVVGADYVERHACSFVKYEVATLISILQEVHDAMDAMEEL